MKRFLAVYTGFESPERLQAWQAMDADERTKIEREAVLAWTDWEEKYAERIVDQGGPLSRTKHACKEGIHDRKNNMAAYVIVTADSLEEAAQMFDGHPHFSLFPGEGVDIMEVMPLPQM